MRLAFLTPPFIKPSEPGLSAEAAAGWFRSRGVDAFAMDASIAWFHHTLRREALERALAEAGRQGYASGTLQAFRQVHRQAEHLVPALRTPETYLHRRQYSSAVSRLVNALRLASVAHPGFHLRLADVEAVGRRPQDSRDLEAIGAHPTPFDAYFTEEILPALEREGVTHAAISLTFLHQAFAAFRLAFLLKERLPHIQRILGGPLVACWSAVGAPLNAPAFHWFHRVIETTSEAGMNALVVELGGSPREERAILAPDLVRTPWDDYLVPLPTVPVALGRGCYWRRCTFCPDYLHPAYEPSSSKTLADWLEAVAARFPRGAMLHLTDSALSPSFLGRIADAVKERNLPLRWHGFVRLEARFADRDFARRLAEGGCAMLQWGFETASPRLLDMMDKGITAEQARHALRQSAEAGIKNHAYLLFGLPTETEADREATLAFVRQEAASLHDLNASILNLPRRSPMHDAPERYGITALSAFGQDTDLSLYADFRCGDSHPRVEARRWLGAHFLKDPTVKALLGDLNAPFKENHSCFLPRR